MSVRLLQPGEDPAAPPGTLEWTTRAGLRYRRAPSLPVPPALWAALPDAVDLPARLVAERHERAATLRERNDEVRAAHARRMNASRDARAADALAAEAGRAAAGHAGAGGVLAVLSETIEHPPAVLDDDPAPAAPACPLETWPREPDGLVPGRPALRLTA